jgi:hypothetical protein
LEIADIINEAILLEVKKGEVLFNRNQVMEHVFIVLEGVCFKDGIVGRLIGGKELFGLGVFLFCYNGIGNSE